MDPADGCDFFWVGKHKSYSGEFSKLCSIKSIMEFSVEGKKQQHWSVYSSCANIVSDCLDYFSLMSYYSPSKTPTF